MSVLRLFWLNPIRFMTVDEETSAVAGPARSGPIGSEGDSLDSRYRAEPLLQADKEGDALLFRFHMLRVNTEDKESFRLLSHWNVHQVPQSV
jgi:hypothetical protein